LSRPGHEKVRIYGKGRLPKKKKELKLTNKDEKGKERVDGCAFLTSKKEEKRANGYNSWTAPVEAGHTNRLFLSKKGM